MAQPTVFLVEDNLVDVKAVKRAFARSKIANPVVTAIDGREAWDMLKAKEIPRPFIMLLDLNMPRMNGIELLEAIRADEELNDSVVFVFTTSRKDEDISASYKLNVAGYMVKSDAGEGLKNLTNLLSSYWQVVELPV